MHMNLPALPFYMVLGAVYAEAYRRSGSLVVPIIAHGLNNSIIVAALLMAHS
jgi:membrane protease YdiL (CAAX protease family)